LALGRGVPGSALAVVLGSAVLALAAFPQGFFLPLLARVWPSAGGARDVSLLFAGNLVGSVAGAHWIGFDAAGLWGRVPALGCAAALAVPAPRKRAARKPC
jgi:hypothetical protein